ncbi:MAG: MASE1 domain-containing protein [Wenzhouxiangella sp.]
MTTVPSGPSTSPPLAQQLPIHLVIFGAWMVAFGAAALLEYAPNASLWFPPAAITFASVFLLGPRAFPVLWLGCLLVTILADQVFERGLDLAELLAAGLAFAATHTLVYGAAALMLRSVLDSRLLRWTPGQTGALLVSLALAAGLSSALGGLSLAASGMAEPAALPALIRAWWIGDYAGLITVGPLFLLVLIRLSEALDLPVARPFDAKSSADGWKALWPGPVARLASLALLDIVLIAIILLLPGQAALAPILLVCLPVQLWIARSDPPLATVLGVFGLTLLLAIAVANSALKEQAMTVQFVVIVLAAASYLGLAASHSVRGKPATT